MHGDKLASGGTSATFPAGKSTVDDPIIFNWKVQDANEVPDSDESWDASAELLKQQAHEKIVSALKPFNDRVLLRRVTEDNGNRVQIAETHKEKSHRGIVLAVGEGMVLGNTFRPISCKVGERVIFGSYSAEEIEIDGEELVIASAFDIRLGGL